MSRRSAGDRASVCLSVWLAQMLAMCSLDALLRIDALWLEHLSSHGFLGALAESLQADDAPLRELLVPQPQDLRPLYLYESKMVSIRARPAILAEHRIPGCCWIDVRVLKCVRSLDFGIPAGKKVKYRAKGSTGCGKSSVCFTFGLVARDLIDSDLADVAACLMIQTDRA